MMQDVYFSVALAAMFVLVKLVMKKINDNKRKDDDEEDETILPEESTFSGQNMMRDGFYVMVLSFIALYAQKEYFTKNVAKTHVFTNEPGF
jgi:hypothetical protein